MPDSRPRQPDAADPRSERSTPPTRPRSRGPGDCLVVGIGASAGGLDACTKLVGALPAGNGMAFILVQHLDPTHESMMVNLLAGHTAMTVRQATDGMPVEPDNLYVIPPGTYLSVAQGALRLSQPQARHGARLPFDFLLNSLAEAYGPRAVCVVLSGTGADGSLGLRAVKNGSGLVIAQDPDEAGYDGMPRNAIATGAVDLVLPVEKIPQALLEHDERLAAAGDEPEAQDGLPDGLSAIVDLLREQTAHDFTLYKPGTLRRRIERRMAQASIETADMRGYLDILRRDPAELDLLAKDLLINVTSFFRDPNVFEVLAERIIPELIRTQAPDLPLRIWIAGCSTGEETYSLAMLFFEQLAAAKRNIKLQVFASDVDPDAVAQAREGIYPDSIEADVSPARLARFFTKEDHIYKVVPDLRAAVVFTVQDVLADPPFSRLDLVSCRNLLIYLRPEAQARVLSVFHFALRPGGILLLGASETAGGAGGHFDAIAKAERIYRHVGHSRPGELSFAKGGGAGMRVRPRAGQDDAPSRHAALARLCQQLVLETYAPAAVLINRNNECLYFLGPTERYLRVASGPPTYDLMAMAHQPTRTKLRSAIQRASQENARVLIGGASVVRDGAAASFSIDAQPVHYQGEDLLLISFIDEPTREAAPSLPGSPQDAARVAELERELEATRTELQGAIHNLEISSEQQRSINEEALSINEEFQSTNEELLTSKEELQSLNEELTALNSQLQETLEQQRTTSNDLQNVLYSTNVATLFLDRDLNIRFFTPATKALLRVISTDLGRPLADLNLLADDDALLTDAREVLHALAPIEREVEAQGGIWYVRRIMPYRTLDNRIEGVVITFIDVTERKEIAKTLEAAKQNAERANLSKSRFLAAASHDLRQPLQTLSLLQGLLAKIASGKSEQKLIALLDQTLGAMSGMLNTLLDINEIDAGTVHAEKVDFPIDDLLGRLREEFAYHAQGKSLDLRVVPSSLAVHSDPRLLEQMIRNLLANALKYTKTGKVLLGCRRRTGMLSVEIWDSGIGIPEEKLQAIFEEYHQLDNAARERSRGLGLGLSIVQRLGTLLNHRVNVRSWAGKGSVFSIDVPLAAGAAPPEPGRPDADAGAGGRARRAGTIMVVEDDPEMRVILELVLREEGHGAIMAADGATALAALARGPVEPDVILADYNLPNRMNGIQVSEKLRERLRRDVPVIILTGDISTAALRDIALHNCVQLNKPVRLKDLAQAIQRLLPASLPLSADLPRAQPAAAATGGGASPVIFVVDDDSNVRDGIRSVLEAEGKTVEDYATCEAFLAAYRPGRDGCLLVDAYLPGMTGLELLKRLHDAGHQLPAIMITGAADVPTAVQAMKAGALDFIGKPIGRAELLASIAHALEQSKDASKRAAWRADAAKRIATLTARQRQIMDMVLAGAPTKNIAADLGISERTVESHRAEVMKRTGSKSLPALARLALTAAANGAHQPSRQPAPPGAAPEDG